MRTIIALAPVLGSWTESQAQEGEAAPPPEPEVEGVAPSTESEDGADEGEDPAEAGEGEEAEEGEAEELDSGPAAIALARALDARLTVWQHGDRQVYVHHCRRARVDCRARVVTFARLLAEAGYRHGVDPFMLAAIALRESGLNPFAEGAAGERGIVQLHPRGVGSRVRFVRNERYRDRCARRADACQGEVLDAGARLVAAAIARCGSVAEGLGRYNTGVCQTTGYSRRVMEERQNLLRLAKRTVSSQAAAAQLLD